MEEFQSQELDVEDFEEDAPSLCDLQIHEQFDVSPQNQSFSSSSWDFEFCNDLNLDPEFASENFMFCGSTIDRDSKFTTNSIARNLSIGKEFTKTRSAERNSSIEVKEKRKRQLVLIGIAKAPARMELSDIRKRQSRRAPVPIIPKVIGDSPDVTGESNGWRNLRRLLKPLRCSSCLLTALGKTSLCCIPHV